MTSQDTNDARLIGRLLTVKHEGRVTQNVTPEDAVLLGYPEAAIRQAVVSMAETQVDQVHAQFMRDLTGGATIEERDTWKTKEEAARALIKGDATSGQTAMITLEAEGDGTDPQVLANTIVAKAEGFQTLIGMAAGLKSKAKAAIAQATAPEVPLDQIEAGIAQVFAQISDQTAAAIAQWQGASS